MSLIYLNWTHPVVSSVSTCISSTSTLAESLVSTMFLSGGIAIPLWPIWELWDDDSLAVRSSGATAAYSRDRDSDGGDCRRSRIEASSADDESGESLLVCDTDLFFAADLTIGDLEPALAGDRDLWRGLLCLRWAGCLFDVSGEDEMGRRRRETYSEVLLRSCLRRWYDDESFFLRSLLSERDFLRSLLVSRLLSLRLRFFFELFSSLLDKPDELSVLLLLNNEQQKLCSIHVELQK